MCASPCSLQTCLELGLDCVLQRVQVCTCSCEGGGGQGASKGRNLLPPLAPRIQKRPWCGQERGTRAGVVRGDRGSRGSLEKPSGCATANSVPCPLQSCPPPSPCHPPAKPPEVLWSRGPAGCGVISAGLKEVQNQNT